MNVRIFGAALILAGCGGCGFCMVAGIRQQKTFLKQMLRVLDVMESELRYRLSPLPELCCLAGRECHPGILREIFRQLESALQRQDQPDVASCMDVILAEFEALPARIRKRLRQLGRSLGRFDLPGQLQGLQALRVGCEGDLAALRKNQDLRIRSYQTLSLCAGTALVILFL